MPRLADVLSDASKRQALVADCQTVIDQEVDDKGGLSGMAIKAAYKVVKGIKPGFIKEAVENLLPDFANNLQPIVDEAEAQGKSVPDYFNANRGRVADAMLVITDERAKKSKHGVVKGTYERLRPTAKKHTEEAVPRVGKLFEKYVK